MKFWTVFLATLIYSSAFAGSETNNAGDFVIETILTAYGPQALNLIEKNPHGNSILAEHGITPSDLQATLVLKNWKLHKKIGKDHRGSDAHALHKVGEPVSLEEETWMKRINEDYSSNSADLKRHNIRLTLHEMLRLLGKNDDGYIISLKLIPEDADVPINADVLVDLRFDQKGEGLDKAGAEKLCRDTKLKYYDQYFFVNCEWHVNHWSETREDTAFYSHDVIVGYKTKSSSTTVRAQARAEGGIHTYRMSAHGVAQAKAEVQRSSYSSQPVYGVVETTKQYTYRVHFKMYGLRVVGIGRLDRLPTKVIYKSNDQQNLKPTTYTHKEDAFFDCAEARIGMLERAPTYLKYYRSKCAVSKETDNSYRFEITTQNPFVLTKN